MPRLKTFVHVVGLNSDGRPEGPGETFGPDDVVPDWAIPLITNPGVWAEAPDPAPSAPVLAPTGTVNQEADPGAPAVVEPDEEPAPDIAVPPRTGKGATRDAWAAYATAHGGDVPDGAGRDDIINACISAGIPVE
jgi:hypothetical protein